MMNLLRAVRPVDVVSFSGLVLAASEICFGCSHCAVVCAPGQQASEGGGFNAAAAAAVGAGFGVVLAPVGAALRRECSLLLVAMLGGAAGQQQPAEDGAPSVFTVDAAEIHATFTSGD